MAFEKRWEAIPARSFTSDGTSEGLVTLTSTQDFKVKQVIFLINNSISGIQLEVKSVISSTQLYVGPAGDIKARQDISQFTVVSNSQIYALEQVKSSIPEKEMDRATFAEEPIVARRVAAVDELGDYFNVDNPSPVSEVGKALDKDWDDLILTRDPISNSIIKAVAKKNNIVVRTIDISLDSNRDFIRVRKS